MDKQRSRKEGGEARRMAGRLGSRAVVQRPGIQVFRTLLLGAAWMSFAAAIPVMASPHVPGYERFHEGVETDVAGGAILFSELGCANCHGGSAVVVKRQGPELIGLNKRVSPDWIEAFLKDPSSGRQGSTMPGLFHGLNDDDVTAVTAYLG